MAIEVRGCVQSAGVTVVNDRGVHERGAVLPPELCGEAADLSRSLCHDPCRYPTVEGRSHSSCGPIACDANSVVFDRAVLDDLATALDDKELDAYLALLEPTVAPRIAQMVRHAAAGEVRGVLESAHALAGGAGCYGLVGLSASARTVEAIARSPRLETLPQAVAEVAALVDASLTAVVRWRCRWEANKHWAEGC